MFKMRADLLGVEEENDYWSKLYCSYAMDKEYLGDVPLIDFSSNFPRVTYNNVREPIRKVGEIKTLFHTSHGNTIRIRDLKKILESYDDNKILGYDRYGAAYIEIEESYPDFLARKDEYERNQSNVGYASQKLMEWKQGYSVFVKRNIDTRIKMLRAQILELKESFNSSGKPSLSKIIKIKKQIEIKEKIVLAYEKRTLEISNNYYKNNLYRIEFFDYKAASEVDYELPTLS